MELIEQLICLGGGIFVGALLASLYRINASSKYRIKIIEMEHDLARATGREPRDIDSVLEDE